MANAENHGLLDMFAAECTAHLEAMRVQLATLASAGLQMPAGDAAHRATAALGDTLHTLAGAARAVDLHDLEYLCRAMEGVLAGGAVPDPSRAALLEAGIELAPQLLVPPSGRVRNQMMALVARCDAASTAGARP